MTKIMVYVERVDVYKYTITVTFKVTFDFISNTDCGFKYIFDIFIERANLAAQFIAQSTI